MTWEEQRKILIAGAILVGGFGAAQYYRVESEPAPASRVPTMAATEPTVSSPEWAPTRFAYATDAPDMVLGPPTVAQWNPPYAVEHVARRNETSQETSPMRLDPTPQNTGFVPDPNH